MRGDLIAAAASLAVWLWAAPALAQAPEPAPAETAPASTEVESAAEPPAKPKDELEISGRVFVRDTLSTFDLGGDRQWRHERDVDSARLQLDYRRSDYLRVNVEVDFGDGEAEIKDTFIRVEPGPGWRLQAGRFKRPMSVIGLESKWSLPSTERGLLSTLEVDGEDLAFAGGRGDGVLARYRLDVPLRPTVTAAVFQNQLGADTGLDASEHFAQDLYLRFEIEPIDTLELASAIAMLGHLEVPGTLDSFSHAAVGSLEAKLDQGWLRVWAEGFVGQSLFSPDETFVAGRLLVSPGIERESWPKRIDPFVSAAFFEPTTGGADDRNAELGGGVSLGFTKYLRLQTDLTHRFAGDTAAAIAGTDVRVQLGARFEH